MFGPYNTSVFLQFCFIFTCEHKLALRDATVLHATVITI